MMSTQIFDILIELICIFIGSSKDYVVIGSDSGKVVVVEFDTTAKNWKVVHSEVFGRTGCRRAIPGQYLAADPKGRALMIGSYLNFPPSELCDLHLQLLFIYSFRG